MIRASANAEDVLALMLCPAPLSSAQGARDQVAFAFSRLSWEFEIKGSICSLCRQASPCSHDAGIVCIAVFAGYIFDRFYLHG